MFIFVDAFPPEISLRTNPLQDAYKILVVLAALAVLAICPLNVRQWLVGGFRTFHAAELFMQLASCLCTVHVAICPCPTCPTCPTRLTRLTWPVLLVLALHV